MPPGPTRTPEPRLTSADWIRAIERESLALAAAAASAGWDREVPTCPGWRVRDLVRHLGGVHRWATAHAAQRRPGQMPKPEAERLMASWPNDPELLDWFRQGWAGLVTTLAEAPADLNCWSFLPAPSPLAFWARRQAHETGIHRADAEAALGAPGAFPVALAADGLEELIFGFARRARLQLASARTLTLQATDSDESWALELGPSRVTARRGWADSGCRVRGSAWQLFLLLWNRIRPDGLAVAGDPQVLKTWREEIQVTWD